MLDLEAKDVHILYDTWFAGGHKWNGDVLSRVIVQVCYKRWGIDIAIRLRKNLPFLTRTRALWVFTKYLLCGPISITIPWISQRFVSFWRATLDPTVIFDRVRVWWLYDSSTAPRVLIKVKGSLLCFKRNPVAILVWIFIYELARYLVHVWDGRIISEQGIVHPYVMECCYIEIKNLFSLRCLPLQAARTSFFIDFTVASALLLLWGEEVCLKPHWWANSWKDLDTKCGPWSVHIWSGTHVLQNDALRADSICVVVVLLPICTMSGQSVSSLTWLGIFGLHRSKNQLQLLDLG